MKQRTLREPVEFIGTGLHTGNHVKVRVLPGEAHTGILFCRRDLDPGLFVKATVSNVREDVLRQTALRSEEHTS